MENGVNRRRALAGFGAVTVREERDGVLGIMTFDVERA